MDKRLLTCAKLCKGSKIADVGTDHGYLPCYMVENGLCKSAVACDVAKMPLESAKAHISACGLEEKISTVLSDGLKNVSPEGITDVVIAGMGGELIAKIIGECDWVKNPDNPVNLVLQPMTKWDFLRKFLYENGFSVLEEKACTEGKFTYSVMSVKFSGNKPDYPCDLRYLYCGLVSADYAEGREYLLRQAKRLETVGNGMKNSAEKSPTAEEMLALSEKIIKEVNI